MPPAFAPSSRREEESARCICLETGSAREEERAAGLGTHREKGGGPGVFCPAFQPVVRCGDIREEEDVAAERRPSREEEKRA